uniref:Retrotransposon gag domain-containing protein n=1 Tax=Tanacetum cinerariifolium TaxID=118510 RepID=A0A6L2NVF5_TANCI|nr:hypothetical protein [Tanacetum cinerariifolium]
MQTRSSSRLASDQSSNPTSSTNPNLKGQNRRRSKQRIENSNLEEQSHLIVTITDNRTMAELLRAPTEGYAKAIVVPPWAARRWLEKEPPRSITTWEDLVSKFINEFFYPSRTTNLRNEISKFQQRFDEPFHEAWDRYKDLLPEQDSLNAAAGGNLLERSTQDVLTIIENKSKCLTAGGNTFPEFRDNIQGYVAAAAVNYNQGNLGYHPLGLANQIRPPGFAQPNMQNNQNRFGPPQGFNRGNKQSYQGPASQNQNVHLNELEKVRRMNEANMKAMQTQIDMVKNELRTKIKSSIQTSLSNQTNEIKNMMASLLQINTAFTSGSGSLPSNTVANPKGELKAITTRSGLVIDRPTVPTPSRSINPEEDERVEETFTDPNLAEYTIKVLRPPAQKYKPPPQREFVVHQRDPRYLNIPYPSRMLKQKHQEKDEVQIHKFCQMFKQHHINITLADALILMPKYQKMLKALLANKEKLELKCKALADLGASINLMPLSVWKKLGLPKLIPTRMTLELANRVICTPDGIARDVFVPVGKFTFLADFVVVDYESDPRVPLILGRPFLRTAHALIDVHGEEMILQDGDERLTLNMKHDTTSYSNHHQRESVNLINIFNVLSKDFLEVSVSKQSSGNPTFSLHPELTSPEVTHEIHDSEGCNVLSEKLPDIDSINDIHPLFDYNPLSGSTTYFSNSLLKEFTDELALITYPLDYNDNLQFDIESDLKEIEFLLYQDKDSSLKDSIDQTDLANLNDYFVDPTPEMFTDEHAPNYSSPLIFDVYDEDFLEVKSDAENIYNDPLDSKGEKIRESKLLIDELDLPCNFHPPPEYDSFISQDFSRVDALPSTNNEDKIFNPWCQKPGHLAARLGCVETKVATWDDLTFKLITLG